MIKQSSQSDTFQRGAEPARETAKRARHERLRQKLLEHAPEGREPHRRTLTRSWILFHSVLAAAVTGLLIFLWSLGGWQFMLVGAIATVGAYFLGYWALYIAVALRARDRKIADDQATRIERNIDRRN